MKIGLDLRMVGEDFGIGRYSFEIAKNILKLDSRNQYVLFVQNTEKFKRFGFEAFPNIQIVLAPFRHYSLEEQFKFSRLLTSHNLDLVHFMNFNVPILYNKPFVVTIHDLIHHKLPGNKKSRIFHRLAYRMVIRHAVKHAKKIITVSNYSKNDIVNTFRVQPDKIAMIYEAANPVPVSDSDVTAAMQKYGVSKPYIVFVGVLERKKNVVSLAQAFDILKGEYLLDIELVLIGKEDPFYPDIAEQLRKIRYRKDLLITGSISSDKEKYALYKGAQAFVSASLFEGFGLPGIEAMTMGIPLIVSNIEVFNEIYDNGAIYFNPQDPHDIAQKIHLLLTDDKYRSMIANHAYERAQYFSWEKAAQETLNVYNP